MVASLLGGSIAYLAATDLKVSGNYENSWGAFYAADGGGRAALGELVEMTRTLGRLPTDPELATITAPDVPGMTYVDFQVRALATPTERVLTAGYFHGLTATSGPYEVRVGAAAGNHGAARRIVAMDLGIDLVPVFQFAVFSDPDLALSSPSPIVLAGRAHTNSDLYVGGPANVRIDGAITAHGDLIRLPTDEVSPGVDAPPDSEPAPTKPEVELHSGLDGFMTLTTDSTDAGWKDRSLELFKGNVRSGEHGVPRLRLTIPDPDTPRQIIEPGLDTDMAAERATKVFYHAQMSINVLNGRGFDAAGSPIKLGNAIDFDVLFDPREQRQMLMVEIDIAELMALPEYPAGAAGSVVYLGSFRPGNGIPDWEIESTSKVPTVIDELDALIPRGGLLGAVRVILDTAVNGLRKLVDDCESGRITEAGGRYDEIMGILKEVVALGGIEPDRLDLIRTDLEPLRTCNITGSQTLDWPEAWEDEEPPYAGGDTTFAVKLINGDDLVNGLTIVSANPVYVQGDYNTKDRKSSAILADALTVLSNAWGMSDVTHSARPLKERLAQDTTINAALMLGVAPGGSGGVGNMIRFVENWTDRTFAFSGSLVTLWNPVHLTGAYVYGAPVFTAPDQEWSFDTALANPANHPPATPTVHAMRMSRWRQVESAPR
jgi:hypothetical protein